ncbi:acetylglutamate kinase [bacterium]|nr:acetylglutamate kinase [bacterium]
MSTTQMVLEETSSTKISVSKKKLSQIRAKTVLIKYGGNAMIDESSKLRVISDICYLKKLGIIPIVVHGGGPAIGELLAIAGIESEFIGGHRKTDTHAMGFVEMALRGKVNSNLVKLLNLNGVKAVGLSGKDALMVQSIKRIHRYEKNGKFVETDLGHVGDVEIIKTELIRLLLENDYTPVIAPIGVGADGKDYNINADMFAGHLAGALGVEHYVVLTDVDGLRENVHDPDTLISELTIETAEQGIGTIVQGGMIPKIESCLIALRKGAQNAHILNGMTPHSITTQLLTESQLGTKITQE